jgi:DNA-directed RNA polymerase subunit RPC12/RpoP
MKTLRKGADKGKQVECKNCGSLIEYMPVDTRKYNLGDYTGMYSSEYTVLDCPECKHAIVLSIL